MVVHALDTRIKHIAAAEFHETNEFRRPGAYADDDGVDVANDVLRETGIGDH